MASEENRARNEEFERRVLALIRDQIASLEEEYPDGFEFGDFVVSCHIYTPPDPDEPMEPWYGGAYPGWLRRPWTRTSSTSLWVDAEILESSLRYTRDEQFLLRRDWIASHDRLRKLEDDEDEEEDEDEDEDEEDDYETSEHDEDD